MGYNSTFRGELHPNKPIPADIAKRINDACLDVRVSGEYEADYWEPGTVIPACVDMKGYNMAEDVVKVQRLLSRHGISLSGDIERTGEEGGDFDKIEVRRGKVYFRPGRIVYGKREERGVESVMLYAVRVYSAAKSKNGWRKEFAGWAAVVKPLRGDVEICPDCGEGDPRTDRPRNRALAVKSLEDAREIVRRLRNGSEGRKLKCEIVSWEDEI